MKIAFHSPLKSPHHPVPSGDRLMARLLIAALERAGHQVDVASDLRTFMREPSAAALAAVQAEAEAEIQRISHLWRRDGAPDLWFTYHLYYKAPDLIGPGLAAEFSIPYVTAEASYSFRRSNYALRATATASREPQPGLLACLVCVRRRRVHHCVRLVQTGPARRGLGSTPRAAIDAIDERLTFSHSICEDCARGVATTSRAGRAGT